MDTLECGGLREDASGEQKTEFRKQNPECELNSSIPTLQLIWAGYLEAVRTEPRPSDVFCNS
jgi:hypothetical protein